MINEKNNGFGIIIKGIITLGIVVFSAIIIQVYQTVNTTAIDVAIIKQQQENAMMNETKQNKEIVDINDRIDKYHLAK